MYIVKNAWKNVIRSKGRNILIGLIVFMISLSTCISLCIRQAAKEAQKTGLENVQITGQISVDRHSMMQKMGEEGADRSQMREGMQAMQDLSVEELETYAKASSVKDFYYTQTVSVNGSDVEAVTSTESTEDSGMGPGMERGQMEGQGDFSVIGAGSEAAMTAFIEGTSQISDGAMFEEGTKKKVCVISDELAVYNSLQVGSKLTLVNPNDETKTVTLTVAGIYTNTSTDTGSGMMARFQPGADPANQIYVSAGTLGVMEDALGDLFVQTNGTYVFADMDAYEQFQEDVKTMGLSDSYVVSSQDVNQYEQSLVPLKNLSTFATYFFLIVLVIGGVILIVIHMFNIRERKYEIGVLTAIGMKKGKVCMQFVLELCFVTMFAMVIGLAAGSVCSVPVSNKLLESQMESQQEQMQAQRQNFGRGEMGNPGEQEDGQQPPEQKGGLMQRTANYMTDISASVNLAVVGQLFAVGILLTLLSGLVAVVFIVRYEPLKILSNRS